MRRAVICAAFVYLALASASDDTAKFKRVRQPRLASLVQVSTKIMHAHRYTLNPLTDARVTVELRFWKTYDQ